MPGYQCLYVYHGHVVIKRTSVPVVMIVTFVIVDTKVAMVTRVTWAPQNILALRIYAACLMTHEL
jgi:hypothetical protein